MTYYLNINYKNWPTSDIEEFSGFLSDFADIHLSGCLGSSMAIFYGCSEWSQVRFLDVAINDKCKIERLIKNISGNQNDPSS